ncbi:hypothetical protein MMC31_004165, partial [Peltigera leucophlebia]|nr:hypothetical protein [Peltigera leucophlebia]
MATGSRSRRNAPVSAVIASMSDSEPDELAGQEEGTPTPGNAGAPGSAPGPVSTSALKYSEEDMLRILKIFAETKGQEQPKVPRKRRLKARRPDLYLEKPSHSPHPHLPRPEIVGAATSENKSRREKKELYRQEQARKESTPAIGASRAKSKDLSQVTCYNCNEKGHYSWKCSELRKAIDAKAKTSLQPTSIIREMDQRCPRGNRPAHTTVAEPQSPSNWDLRDISSERAFSPAANANTTNARKAKSRDLSHITCFNCDKKGHYANGCPERRKDQNVSED